MKIPHWLAEKLSNPPSSGEGIHGWLFSVARQLHVHASDSEIIDALVSATRGCNRPVPMREIADAARNSRDVAWSPKGRPDVARFKNSDFVPRDAAELPEKWPRFCEARRAARIRDSFTENFTGFDRVKADDVDDVIDDLFPSAEWLCLAKGHPATARSRKREKWFFESAGCDLIVPSPMTGPSGKRQDGKLSHRCLENTATRRWLVIEFDSGTIREQSALHFHFSQQARLNGWPELKLAVFSGMKSLHGWYGPVADEDSAKTLMSYAVMHGADASTWTRCQLVRLPGGVRKVPLAKVNMPPDVEGSMTWTVRDGKPSYEPTPTWDDLFPDGFTQRQQILYYAQ